jgi:hypothetical protein
MCLRLLLALWTAGVLTACNPESVEFTPTIAVIGGRVLDASGMAVAARVDASVHADSCAGRLLGKEFGSPHPITDSLGRCSLLLRTVEPPALRCVRLVARRTVGGDSVVVEVAKVMFKFSPQYDSTTVNLAFP